MVEESQPGERYWAYLEPVWSSISIYDGPAEFRRAFRRLRTEVGHLLAAHWCQSEVRNGGLHQFFSNSTGVLAPEALAGFRAIGLHEWAEILRKAINLFGDSYPRKQEDRLDALEGRLRTSGVNWNPFSEIDDRFFAWLNAEPNRWEHAADRYAATIDAR